MRDGVNLAADLYLPKDAGGRFPVIVIRTPYNKDTYRGSIGPAEFFAGQGFGVVAEDVRGKWHSEGDYRIQSHDRDDGYDTIDWAATLNLFRTNAVSARARENQYVIISPTGHCASEAAGEHTMVGDRDVGDARYGYWQIYLSWFDYWLKGVGTGIGSMPKVHYYVIGANEWRTANTWPLPDIRPVRFYLSSRRGANTRGGDGILTRTPPPAQGKDTLTFDPDDPFPSRGGTICCTGNPKDLPGIFDQADLETRPDLLVYSTPPLATSLTIAGPVRANLYISSDAKDTDFTAKVIDVDPDGKAWNVVDGVARVRYRNGLTRPALMEPGQVYEIKVNIKSIAYQFKAGHQIRLYLSSSNFPQWERNSNTGGNIFDEATYLVAHNAVHFGPRRPSVLILPVVPK